MHVGRVAVSGMSWAAYIKNGDEPIKKGQRVEILAIDGVKLYCKVAESEKKTNVSVEE